MRKPEELTDEQFNELIDAIARPTFNYMLKRITKEVLENKDYKSLDANQFYNMLIAMMSSMNTNLLRWIQTFHKIKTNDEINFTALQSALIHHTNEQLKIVLQ